MQLPYPPNTGERIRNFNLLRVLGKTQEIHLLSLIQSPTERDFIPEIEKYCRQVDTVLLRKYSKLKHLPGVVRRIMSGQPMDTKFYFLPAMVEKMEEVLSTHVFDIIQIEHSYMASYLEVIPKNVVSKKVLTFIDVESARLHKMLKMEKNPYWRLRYLLNWLPMRRWEARIATIVDKCITTSQVDKERLQSISKFASVSVIPNGVDVDLLKPLPFTMQSKILLFVGTLQYPPNVDAASYFAREVFPYVVRQIPDATFVIVGSHPPEKIQKLGREKNIVVSGWVEDIRPYYEQSAVCVVPLRAGGGTRLKILEAMALGRPVVSTSIGCEGLDVTEGRDILIADTTTEFAAATVRLLMDAALQGQLSHNARRLVETRYGWEAIGEDLIRVYSDLAAGSRVGC